MFKGKHPMLSFVRNIDDQKEVKNHQQLAGLILDRLNRKNADLELIRDILVQIKQYTDFSAVGIRLRDGDDFPYFETKGFSEDFVKTENYLCLRNKHGRQVYDSNGRPFLECMCGNVLSGRTDPDLPFFTKKGSFWTNSTTKLLASVSSEDLQGVVRSRCNQNGYESVALIPLRSGHEIVGLLQFNDIRPGRFTIEMIRFFEEIGVSIGICLAKIRAEEAFQAILKTASEKTGREFFDTIVSVLSDWLGAEYALVGEIVNGNVVKALSLRMPDGIQHDYSYDLAGTPCEDAIGKGFCFYSSSVRKKFPDDKDLIEFNIESYVGIKVADENNGPIGLLCVFSTHQLKLPPKARSIMEIMGARVLAEIQRKRTAEEFRRQGYYLEKAQQMGNIGTWELDIKNNKLV
ncbi:MAG: GAF domain-containing protein, partial [Planctomycetota bacterium]